MPNETSMPRPTNRAPAAAASLTVLLNRMSKGDHEAGEQAARMIYGQMRRIASSRLRSERANHTLQTTGLVHEAYLRLSGGAEIEVRDRAHFYALASQQMRRILIDYARAQRVGKRNGGVRVDLDLVRLGSEPRSIDVLALDEALHALERIDPRAAKGVELHYFGGYSEAELADALDISAATVRRDWAFARSWLFDRMRPSAQPQSGETRSGG
jgi:RNA polymerase sigma factor (TIGR02999 family)